MRIRILETGESPKPLDQEFGGYPAMMERMLAPLSPRFSFSATPVSKGAPVPPLSEFDGLLITGSPAGVYEGHAWIAPSEALVRRAIFAGKPVVGICFGHQMMAQAFGGKVEKSDKGWGVGVHVYDVKAAADWMTPMQSRIACVVSHQDQVVETPEGARVLGGSDFCPNGVIEYAQGPAVSFQPHPEFSHEYAEALLRRLENRIPKDVFETALDSLKRKSDRGLIARWIANFFLQHAR